jgi:hypothetical protein
MPGRHTPALTLEGGFTFDAALLQLPQDATRPLVQRVTLGHLLQRTDLVHHLPPYRMPGIIARQPRPLGPERGIELRLGSMQTDQMRGHMPEISFVHDTPVLHPLLPKNGSMFARLAPFRHWT